MALLVNLRHLERAPVHLCGELGPEELDLPQNDEVLHVKQPLIYDLELQRLESAVVAQGKLELTLDCECVRCLRPFQKVVRIDPWVCHLALEGEDKVAVVNDLVDLTPPVREDILLEFPQHPLCGTECGGLPRSKTVKKTNTGGTGQTQEKNESAWAELNKLKL